MRVSDIPEIEQVSAAEKILLLEDLWDSIAVDESSVPVPRSHMAELHRRMQSYEADPGTLLSLEELRGKIEKRK